MLGTSDAGVVLVEVTVPIPGDVIFYYPSYYQENI